MTGILTLWCLLIAPIGGTDSLKRSLGLDAVLPFAAELGTAITAHVIAGIVDIELNAIGIVTGL